MRPAGVNPKVNILVRPFVATGDDTPALEADGFQVWGHAFNSEDGMQAYSWVSPSRITSLGLPIIRSGPTICVTQSVSTGILSC